jgi:hypothetical protein
MAVIKNENTGKWEVRTYYKDAFTGERKQKTKRGFKKKSEAKAWEEAFKLQRDENLDMTMKAFVEIYLSDISPRLKENTLMTKRYIIDEKILPYFAHKKLQEIKPSDVIKWQNEIMSQVSGHGRPYSPVYLKTISLVRFLIMQKNYMDCKIILPVKRGTWEKREMVKCSFGRKKNICNLLKA